jgi:hypothetical protein
VVFCWKVLCIYILLNLGNKIIFLKIKPIFSKGEPSPKVLIFSVMAADMEACGVFLFL